LPTNPLAVGNILYFVQEIEPYGRELWRSDGTMQPAGRALVQDLVPATGTELYMLDMANLRYTTYMPLMVR